MTKDGALTLALEYIAESPVQPADSLQVDAAWQTFCRTADYRKCLQWAEEKETPGALFVAFRSGLNAIAQPVQPDNTSKLYEELRSIIDGGSESFTHADAVQYLKDSLTQLEHPEQMARLGWQYFECPACGSEGAKAFPKPEPWTSEDMAYRPGGLAQPEQPVQPKRKWIGLTESDKNEICRASDDTASALIMAEDLLKEQNT